jgi:hypothetical protein
MCAEVKQAGGGEWGQNIQASGMSVVDTWWLGQEKTKEQMYLPLPESLLTFTNVHSEKQSGTVPAGQGLIGPNVFSLDLTHPRTAFFSVNILL